MARKSFADRVREREQPVHISLDNSLKTLNSINKEDNQKVDIKDKQKVDIKDKLKDKLKTSQPNHVNSLNNVDIKKHKKKSNTAKKLENKTNITATEKSIEKTAVKPASPSNTPVVLVVNEAILYYCLKHLNEKTTTMAKISKATGTPVNTLRACLKRLRKKGMVEHYGLKNEAGQIGFAAKAIINEFVLKGDKNKLKQKLSKINYDTLPILTPINDIFDNK